MNKRQKKKEYTKKRSNKFYIKYWKIAFRSVDEKLLKAQEKNEKNIDMLIDAAKNLIEQKNQSLILENKCSRYQLEIGRLSQENDKLRQELEECKQPWWKRWMA